MNLLKSILIAWAIAGTPFAWAGESISGPQEQARADLKIAVLSLQVAAEHQADVAGAEPGLTLYLGQDSLTGTRIEQVQFALDNAEAGTLGLDSTAAAALLENTGLAELYKTRLAPGPHSLHFTVSLRATAGKTVEAAPSLELDYPFVVGEGDSRFELHLVAGRLLKADSLELRPWKQSDRPASWLSQAAKTLTPRVSAGQRLYDRGDTDDPRVRHARFLMQTGRPEDALVQLLAVPTEAGAAEALPPSYSLLTAATYRVLGGLDQARAICDRLDSTPSADRALIAAERLLIGQALFERGELADAEAQLLKARDRISSYLAPDWRFAYAQVLVALDRVPEAVKLLGELSSEQVDAFRYLNASAESQRAAQYQRYNLAATLVQTGEEQKGLSWLDLVGRLDSKDPELLALRDKANLALGWHFLNLKQGNTAIGLLGRIGSDGAFSNSALLGMGWAQLAPAGERRLPRIKLVDTALLSPESNPSALTAPVRNSLQQLRVLEPELHGAIGPRSFTHEAPPKDRREGLHRALRLWTLLVDHDIHDPATQEGTLAIAYAFDQLRDTDRAREAYNSAIERLSQLRQELGSSESFVRDGQLIAAIDRAPDTAAAMVVIDDLRILPGDAAEPLVRSVNAYRSLGQMLQRLDEITARFDDAAPVAAELRQQSAELRQSVTAMLIVDAQILQKQVLDLAQAQGSKLDQYLTAARFSAARIQDRAQGEGPTMSAPPESRADSR